MDCLNRRCSDVSPFVQCLCGTVGSGEPYVCRAIGPPIEGALDRCREDRLHGRAVYKVNDSTDARGTRGERCKPARLAAGVAAVVDVDEVRPEATEESAQAHVVRRDLRIADGCRSKPRCRILRSSYAWSALVSRVARQEGPHAPNDA